MLTQEKYNKQIRKKNRRIEQRRALWAGFSMKDLTPKEIKDLIEIKRIKKMKDI